jgi:hypothetical protein
MLFVLLFVDAPFAGIHGGNMRAYAHLLRACDSCIIAFMIKAIHISPVYNRQSIAEKGLIPTKIKLPHHLRDFKEHDVCTKDDKVLYSWIDCNQNEKFIRDMIFCNLYINPRNALYDIKNFVESIDFRKLLNKNMAPWSYMMYDVYEIKAQLPKHTYFHSQDPTGDINRTTYGMPDEYSHNDKVLCVLKEPQKKIRIIGQAEYYYDNGHNIRIIR